MTRIVYESNGATVGDGTRITRVSDGGQTLSVMVNPKTEKFSRVMLVDLDKRTIDTFTSDTFTRPGDAMRAEAAFHREFIEGMTDAEAVKYLLDVVEVNLAANQEKYARIKDHVPTATRQDVKVMSILWESRPRLMTYGAIGQRVEWIGGGYTTPEGIRTTIKRLRAALDQTDHPIEIQSHYGMGYSLTAPDDWVAPWDSP